MRKLCTLLVVLAIALAMLVPTALTGATSEDCCDFPVGSCCWQACCDAQTFWFEVSYLDKVPTGYFWHGVEMVAGVWTTEYVEAHDADEAAETIGLRAGYDCWVTKAPGYDPG